MTGKVNVRWHSSLGQLNHNRHIELRVVLLHVPRPVLLAEFLNHEFDVVASVTGITRNFAPTPHASIPIDGRVYFDQEFVVLGSGFVHLLELEKIGRSVLGVQNRFHKCSLWWYPLLTHFRRNRLVPPDFPQDRLHRETANVPMYVPRFRRGVPAL